MTSSNRANERRYEKESWLRREPCTSITKASHFLSSKKNDCRARTFDVLEHPALADGCLKAFTSSRIKARNAIAAHSISDTVLRRALFPLPLITWIYTRGDPVPRANSSRIFDLRNRMD